MSKAGCKSIGGERWHGILGRSCEVTERDVWSRVEVGKGGLERKKLETDSEKDCARNKR